MNTTLRGLAATLLTFALVLSTFHLVEARDKVTVVIPAGTIGGSMYTAAINVSRLLNKYVEGFASSVGSGGSQENVQMLESGEALFAIGAGLDYGAVFKKTPRDSANVRSVLVLFKTVYLILVPKSSTARTIYDLKGQRVQLGDRRTGQYLFNSYVMDALGLKESEVRPEFLSTGAGATAFTEGKVDAYFFPAGVPSPALTQMASSARGARLISLSDEDMRKVIAKYPVLSMAEQSEKDLTDVGVKKPLKLLMYWGELLANARVPDDLVYDITKTLVTNHAELVKGFNTLEDATAQNTVNFTPFKLHPGAQKYYREIGVVRN